MMYTIQLYEYNGYGNNGVVHISGIDALGWVVFARTNTSLRELNSLFHAQKITQKYETLVCGHIANDNIVMYLPFMREYESPPHI